MTTSISGLATDDCHELRISISSSFLRLDGDGSSDNIVALAHVLARLRVPALIKIINGSLIDTVSPVSGALVAADVHPNLFLKSVNAKAVNEPEEEGKRGENDHSPTEDKKDCTKLDEKESAVATVKPNHMTAHKVRRCIYNQEKKSIKEGNDGRNTYTPTCSHLSAAISNLAGLLKKPQERTPHAPPNK